MDKAIIEDISKIVFTHLWVDGFGWENTILIYSDFVDIELFGIGDIGELVFICEEAKGKPRILKGNILNQ
jgi:hypothetical protein